MKSSGPGGSYSDRTLCGSQVFPLLVGTFRGTYFLRNGCESHLPNDLKAVPSIPPFATYLREPFSSFGDDFCRTDCPSSVSEGFPFFCPPASSLREGSTGCWVKIQRSPRSLLHSSPESSLVSWTFSCALQSHTLHLYDCHLSTVPLIPPKDR